MKGQLWSFGGYFLVIMMVGGMVGIAQAVPAFWTGISVVGALAMAVLK